MYDKGYEAGFRNGKKQQKKQGFSDGAFEFIDQKWQGRFIALILLIVTISVSVSVLVFIWSDILKEEPMHNQLTRLTDTFDDFGVPYELQKFTTTSQVVLTADDEKVFGPIDGFVEFKFDKDTGKLLTIGIYPRPAPPEKKKRFAAPPKKGEKQ
jgi:hypothetical protein